MKHLPEAIEDVRYEKLPFEWNGYEFYRKKGIIRVRKYFERHSREDLLNDPRLENVRKSNRAFGGCARLAKLFRESISPALMLKIPHLHSRLNGLFRQLLDLDLTQPLGKRTFSHALYNRFFLSYLQQFTFSPKADYWLADVVRAIAIDPSNGVLTFDTAAIDFDALEKFIHFEVVLGEVLFDWEKQDYSHSFTGFRVYYHENRIYRLEPEFQVTSRTQTHFYMAGILAQPDFDLSRKRNRQIEEYLGLKFFIIG